MKIDKRRHLISKLAYIAGFIDGEGCIRIKHANQGGNSYYVTVHATNSDRKPLNEIKKLFGGKIYFQEKGRNKLIWQHYITSCEATDMLRTILGFLITKKKQAQLAIKFHDNKELLSPTKKAMFYKKMRKLKLLNPELLETGNGKGTDATDIRSHG